MTRHPAPVQALLALALAVPVLSAQRAAPAPELPPRLPEVRADSPRDTLLYADRIGLPSEEAMEAAAFAGGQVQVTLPTSETGTGFAEIFWYQLPGNYDDQGPAHPMVLAYHGFGASAASVANQSTIDEECDARGWIYVSVTGIDDQIFGTPLCQQNVRAALDWMIENFNVDTDRLYVVGFSMGGGVALNLAAQQRDPDGLMFAAAAAVSGSYDYAQSYDLDPALRPLLENPFNFGGSPAQEPFRYAQASDMSFMPGTYPPLPGVNDPVLAMATNLDTTPVYLTWDTQDTIPQLPPQAVEVAALLDTISPDFEQVVVTGTVDDQGQPATHSWSVLDEVDLFDFFDQHVVDRVPEEFAAQIDEDDGVSYLDLEQRAVNAFSYVDGDLDVGGASVEIDGVINASEVTLSLADTALSGASTFGVTATSADVDGFTLRITGLDDPPSYLLDATSGVYVQGTSSDPATESLLVDVPGNGTLDVDVVSVPWPSKLWLTPQPATTGGPISLLVDAPPQNASSAYVFVSVFEGLQPLPGGLLLAIPLGPPTIVLPPLPLDPAGDITVNGAIPSDPGLIGARILFQMVVRRSNGSLGAVSNLFALDIE